MQAKLEERIKRAVGSGRATTFAAATAFSIRIANAALAYLSQIIMARWMGAFEYGIYAYAWTWILVIGTVSDLGFAITAQRFIPTYLQNGDLDKVRGFIFASRWVPVCFSILVAMTAAFAIWLLSGRIEPFLIVPLYLACLVVPPYGLSWSQDGVARAFGWINVALIPAFIVRPLLLLALLFVFSGMGFSLDASIAMWVTIAAIWVATIAQALVVRRRTDANIEAGRRRYEGKLWLTSAMPILAASVLQFMLSYVGVLLLQAFRTPNDVAVFYAATKITAIVSMVYFAVTASVAYRFAALEASGDREGLARFYRSSTRSMFWPALLVGIVIVVLAKPLLSLFGEVFISGYGLIWVLTAGLVLRAAIGPAEQFLNMMGKQRVCAIIYAVAFAFNLAASVLLAPQWGALGAAIATTGSIMLESMLFYRATRRQIGLGAFVAGAKHG